MASAPTDSTSGIEISNQGPNADSLVNDALTSIQENLTAPKIFTIGAGRHASSSNAYSLSPAAGKLATIVSQLAQSSLQPSSVPTYKRAWALFAQFRVAIFNEGSFTLPLSPSVVALFIAYLFDLKYASSTVNTYVSALGYTHRMSDLPDPTRVFYVTQILKGYVTFGFLSSTYTVGEADGKLRVCLGVDNLMEEFFRKNALQQGEDYSDDEKFVGILSFIQKTLR
ncbi:uncharacterized protein LOC114540946 [Dendronephthya gigantea]|uniref:uncharacterized protein LOC114540946 n=1 Tax=Dendronephthya gigantea TaxID=151771 RepID=UPI00106BAD8C|nr:uncharacterized protein LOC114540946 [Dendronephthya gigantea]